MTRVHLSLRTPDLPGATAFYTTLFGVEPDKVHDDYVRFAPEGIPILLSLMPGEAGVDHLGLRLPTPAAAAALVRETTGETLSEGVVCCHATKDESWVTDPDGRPWEIYAVTDEAPEAAPTLRACCP